MLITCLLVLPFVRMTGMNFTYLFCQNREHKKTQPDEVTQTPFSNLESALYRVT